MVLLNIAGTALARSIVGSMTDIAPDEGPAKGQDQDGDVEPQAAAGEVLGIKLHLALKVDDIPAIDLCPSGQPRPQDLNASARPQGDQVMLCVQGGPWANQAHFARKYAPELGKLVEAGPAKPTPCGRDPPVRILKRLGRHVRRLGAHGPELRHQEEPVVPPEAGRPVQGRSGRVPPDQDGEDKQKGKEQKQARAGAIAVTGPLTVTLTLPAPDISLIAGMSDYPAAIVHQSYDNGDPSVNPIGTGPYLPETNEVGVRQTLVRNANHTWWGDGAYLDRIEYIDYGTDPAAVLAAAQSGEIDATYRTEGDFVAVFDGIGWTRTEAITAGTLAVRFHQAAAPYDNLAVRKALQLAVDNKVVLELGFAGLGQVAENHHVCPIHPEYAQLPPLLVDPAAAKVMIAEAGHADTEFELISLDDNWQAATCDAVAAQLRDAGINIKRSILPGSTFWNDWLKYPFSATEWNMRPLGVQILALAYKSGVAWNETAFANPEFDAELTKALAIADASERRKVMERLQLIMQEQGVLIQPFWRSVFRHANANVRGADAHPIFEHHHYKWWIAA